MPHTRVCLIGGSGFVGRHILCALGRRRIRSRVLTRNRARHPALWVFPDCEVVETPMQDEAALAAAMTGCSAVINLAGILNESPRPGGSFREVHEDLPARVAAAAAAAGISRLLHMSALGARADGPSQYLRSKARGEAGVRAGELGVTVLRPSVIFGADDSFTRRFAGLLALSPVMPLACPAARFAPVFVADVAEAFIHCLNDKNTIGGVYELCGPNRYTLKELVESVARISGRKRVIIGLNDTGSRWLAAVATHLPGKPLTPDNYRSLQSDCTCTGDDGFARLGITPKTFETIVPEYLGARDRNRRYSLLRTFAGRK